MVNLSDLIGELEAVAESQRLLCLALDSFCNPIGNTSSRAVTNFSDTVEDMLARIIDRLKDNQAACETTPLQPDKGA